LNSSTDDFGLIFTEDKKQGYLTSDREGGTGSDDIYRFYNEGITLEGIVVDVDTDEPICDAEVVLAYLDEEQGTRVVECDGEFEFSVLPGRDYSLEGCAEGYNCKGVNTTTKGVEPGGKVFVKIPLKKFEPIRMEVLVVDKKTRNPIHLSKVAAFNKCDEVYTNKESNEAGMSYYDEVTIDCDYNVSANAEGYLPGDADVSVDGTQNPVKVLIELTRLKGPPGPSPSLVLRHIYYDFDQSYIRQEAEIDLNKVLSFMEVNPGAIVEIGSHTDARASFSYNEGLSDRRAKAAVNWLIERGISRERLVGVGYGELQLTNECADNVQCSEEQHQRNRRTEFRVLDIVKGIDEISLERFDMIIDPCHDCPF
jgi:outer membrane protein OmpA-like peptidoglycan-associated protein